MALLMVLLTGCRLSKPPSHSQLVINALPAGTTVPPAWVTDRTTNEVANNWLATFHDPVLDVIVAEALTNNLDLRAAAERVEIARQNVVVVGASLKPQIGMNLGHRSTRDDGHDDWYQGRQGLAGVAWEPDVWGKLRAQKAGAQAGFEATALEYNFARQSLAATTAKSWYLATESSQLLAVARESVAIYSRLLDLVKIRRVAGKIADLEVAEAKGNLDAAQSQLRAAQGAASDAKRNLEVLLGRYPSAELQVAEHYTPVPPPIQPGLPSSLLERRPDLVAAESQVLAAFRLQEAARLALLPSFSLNLDGGKLSDNLLSVLQVNPWMFSAALGMYVPIYTGGALRAEVKIATATQLQAVSVYGSAVLRAFREVENGLMNENLLAERLAFEQKVLNSNTEAVRIARIQYEAGSMDLLSVLQLQETQIRTQQNVIQLRNAQLANHINLHLALGGSFESAPAVAGVESSSTGSFTPK
ncbi:MAG: TolC family protein [Verrucomicrobia bacterium]|nr:TolC family protein [Verrucomicrobiota bacterium]